MANAPSRTSSPPSARREGTSVYYRLSNPRIVEACDIVHSILMDHLAHNRELADKLL